MRASFRPFLTGAVLIVTLTTPVLAQRSLTAGSSDGMTPPALTPGSPSGTSALSAFEAVNPFNGKLNVAIPLMHPGARGEAGYAMTAVIDRTLNNVSRIEECHYDANGIKQFPCPLGTLIEDGSWSSSSAEPGLSPGTMWARSSGDTVSYCNEFNGGGTGTLWYWANNTTTRLTFTAPDGTETNFVDTQTYGAPQTHARPVCSSTVYLPNSRGTSFIATDGSGTRFTAGNTILDYGPGRDDGLSDRPVSGVMQFANGTTYTIADGLVTGIRDRNGNLMTLTYNGRDLVSVTDSIERRTTISGQATNMVTITDPAGRVTRLRYDALGSLLRPGYLLKSADELFPDLAPASLRRDRFLASIEYPNGRSLSFRYNDYGEVARIELPAGGAFEYDWQNVGNGLVLLPHDIYFDDMTSYIIYRRVAERRVYNSGNALEQVQVYEIPADLPQACTAAATPGYPDSCVTTARISYTDGTRSINAGVETHYFYGSPKYIYLPVTGINIPNEIRWLKFFSPWKVGREYKTTFGTSSNPPFLQTGQTQWHQSNCLDGNCWFTDPNADTAPPHDTRAVQTLTTLGARTASTISCFDRYNNRTDVYEYDYGVVTSMRPYCSVDPAYVRNTHTEYKTEPDYTASSINLIRLPVLEQVFGPVGLAAQTTFSYDDYGELPLTPRSILAQHDSGFQTAYTRRGNLTKISRWLFDTTPATPLTTRTTYDIAGNVVKVTDPRGYSTTYGFDGSCGYGFPASVTDALHSNTPSFMDYNCNLGTVTLFTDPNGTRTRYSYETSPSSLGRLAQVDRAYGTSLQSTTTFTYDDTPGNVGVTSSLNVSAPNPSAACTPNGPIVTSTAYDGLGRESIVTINSPAGPIQSRRIYDERGRLFKASNPSVPGESIDFAISRYDPLGRITSLTSPDGSISTTEYTDNTATAIDPARKARSQTLDALGRLSQVGEGPVGNQIPTAYAYDALDNLKLVCQNGTIAGGSCYGGQVRSFTYDSLSRLKSTTNPETGTIQYSAYDNNGNLMNKVDSRSVLTTYDYDPLNRLLARTYSDGTPRVRYEYDGAFIGPPNRISTLDSTNAVLTSTAFTYDALGRVKTATPYLFGLQTLTGAFSYDYDAADHVIGLTYPSQRKINYCYDSAGRTGRIVDNAAPFTVYASGPATPNHIQYASFGGIRTMTLGNGVSEVTGYNTRMQPISLNVTRGAPVLTLGYTYAKTSDCNVNTPSCNNGNLYRQDIAIPGITMTQNYEYDSLNRLLFAEEPGANPWRQQYAYDSYGNRWLDVDPQHTGTSYGLAVDPRTPTASTAFQNTNRLSIINGFDSAGNQVLFGGWSLAYDAENRQTSATQTVNGVTARHLYDYDGEGRRVRHQKTQYNPATGGWDLQESTTFVYEASGKLAAEYGPVVTPPCLTCYLTTDRLGSTRLITDENGTVKSRADYLPFGEEIPSGINGRSSLFGQTTTLTQKFTGKERDVETALDYFGTRYYSSAQGRLTSPDLPLIDQDPSDPQSWNLYSYVRNNPLKYVDPTGQDCVYTDDIGSNGTVSVERGNCSSRRGTFVNGTIDTKSLAWNSDNRTLGYSYSGAESTIGTGVIEVSSPGDELDAKGLAFVEGMAARVDASNNMVLTLAGLSTAAGVGAGAYPYAAQFVNEVALGPAMGRLFFEGKVGFDAATAFGVGRVISNSPLGERYRQLGQPLGTFGWQILSRFWASGAAGSANIFPSFTRPESLLWRTELPSLLRNPNVIRFWR